MMDQFLETLPIGFALIISFALIAIILWANDIRLVVGSGRARDRHWTAAERELKRTRPRL